jgi:hypothetical protein
MDDPGKVYADAVSATKKVLGKEGDLPKPRVDPVKTLEDARKAALGLNKSREEMEKTLIEVQTAVAKAKAVAKQYGDLVDGYNFGLNAKDPKDKKTIDAATKTMLDGLQQVEGLLETYSGRLDKLDKMLTDLSRLDK